MKLSLTLASIVMIGLSLMSGHAAAGTEPADTTVVTVLNPFQSVVAPADSAGDAVDPLLQADPTAQASAIALPTDTGLTDTAGLVARTGLSLLAVIFLIWGAVQILKKLSPGGTSAAPGSHIRVLDRAHIAPKKSIYVVQIGERAIALGLTDQQMTLLTDLDLEDTLERYAEKPALPVTQRFSEVFKTVNARIGRRTTETAASVRGTEEPAT